MNKKVSQIKIDKQLTDTVKEAVDQLGGIDGYIKNGDRVLLKPNFNTADPFPASSSPDFLEAVLELVMIQNPREIVIADSSTFFANTKTVMKRIGVYQLLEKFDKLKIISFDDEKWVKKKIPNGKYLRSVSVPARLDEVDKLILLPCLKTHFIAQYTGALKLSVGLMKTTERASLHMCRIQEKIAELNLVINPDLVIMDARKCFITKGPMEGEVREPGLLMASESRVEIDKRGVEIIKFFQGNDLESISANNLIQLKYSQEIGIN